MIWVNPTTLPSAKIPITIAQLEDLDGIAPAALARPFDDDGIAVQIPAAVLGVAVLDVEVRALERWIIHAPVGQNRDLPAAFVRRVRERLGVSKV